MTSTTTEPRQKRKGLKDLLGGESFFNEESDLTKIIDRFTLRPADQVYYYEMADNESKDYRSDFCKALFNNLTPKLKEDISYAMKGERNYTYQIIGDTGTGKSSVALTIGSMTKQPYARFYTLEAVLIHLKAAGPFSGYFTYIMDEPLYFTGDATNTTDKDFKNVNQMCRQFDKNFIHNVHSIELKSNINIYLETFGIDYKKQQIRCLWCNKKTARYQGYIILEDVIIDKSDSEQNLLKVEQWKDLIEHEGSRRPINLKDLLAKALDDIHTKNLVPELEDISDIKFYLSEYPHLTSSMKADLAHQIRKVLEKETQPTKKEKKFSYDQFTLMETESLDSEVFEELIPTLPFAEKDQAVIALLIAEGLKTTDALKRLKDNRFKDSRFMLPVHLTHFYSLKAKEIGICMEKKYAQVHPEWEHQGGPDKPDFLFPEKETVIAFKAVLPPEGIKKQMIDIGTEWETAKALGWTNLWSLVCCFRTKEVYHYKYEGAFE